MTPYNCAIRIWSPDGGMGLCSMTMHDQTNNRTADRTHDTKTSIQDNCEKHLYDYLKDCRWLLLAAAPIFGSYRKIIGFVYTVRVEQAGNALLPQRNAAVAQDYPHCQGLRNES